MCHILGIWYSPPSIMMDIATGPQPTLTDGTQWLLGPGGMSLASCRMLSGQTIQTSILACTTHSSSGSIQSMSEIGRITSPQGNKLGKALTGMACM